MTPDIQVVRQSPRRRVTNKTRPLPQILPPFIVARDRFAVGAGLTIEREWSGEELITRYLGGLDVLVKSPFIEDKDIRIPVNERNCVKLGVWEPPGPRLPRDKSLVGAFRRGAMAYVKYSDRMPLEFSRLPNGTEHYVYADHVCAWTKDFRPEFAVYVGLESALLADDVISSQQIPRAGQDHAYEQIRVNEGGLLNSRVFTLWETDRLANHRIRHTKYLSAEKQAEEARKAIAPRYASAEGFRKEIATPIKVLRGLLRDFSVGPQSGPVKYLFEQDVVGKLDSLAAEMEIVIAQASVVARTNAAPPSLSIVRTRGATP